MNTTLADGIALNSIGSGSTLWIMTIIVMVAIIIGVGIVALWFKKFLMGAVIVGLFTGLFFLSRWVASDYVAGSPQNFYFIMWAVGFVIVSVIVGSLIYMIPAVRRFIDGIDDKEE